MTSTASSHPLMQQWGAGDGTQRPPARVCPLALETWQQHVYTVTAGPGHPAGAAAAQGAAVFYADLLSLHLAAGEGPAMSAGHGTAHSEEASRASADRLVASQCAGAWDAGSRAAASDVGLAALPWV